MFFSGMKEEVFMWVWCWERIWEL